MQAYDIYFFFSIMILDVINKWFDNSSLTYMQAEHYKI